MNVENLKFLEFENFKKAWKKKAKSLGKKQNVELNANFWLLNVQNFLEFFFLDHLNISIEDAIDFEYTKDLEKAGNNINSRDLLDSLIFCSANSALAISAGLKYDAYEYALKKYGEGSSEEQWKIDQVVKKYQGNFETYGQVIISLVDDFILTKRLEHIKKNFSLREADYQAVKNHLTTEFNSSLVFGFDGLYNTYSIAYNKAKSKKGKQ